jgi:XTP/dITP diphosphohydrolase
MTQKLLVATHNRGKIVEYRALLHDLPLAVTWLNEQGVTEDVEETGATFSENACLKAEAYARLTGLWTWADDSGLEVDALGGRPGVYSARYGGPGLTDVDRYRRLLDDLAGTAPEERTARFRCVVALAMPSGPIYTAEAAIEGLIADAPRGDHGFGYDPVFFIPDYQRTMAELDPALKNRISHRSRAAVEARRIIISLLDYVQRIEP